eukprot:2918362-Rhodomonas_salina.2
MLADKKERDTQMSASTTARFETSEAECAKAKRLAVAHEPLARRGEEARATSNGGLGNFVGDERSDDFRRSQIPQPAGNCSGGAGVSVSTELLGAGT